MAKVYGPPESLKVPDILDFRELRDGGDYDIEAYRRAEEKFMEDLAAWCRARCAGDDLIGEEVRFPIADGYAVYVIGSTRPLTLVHVPIGDAYQIPDAHARGLMLEDVAEMVRQRRSLAALFKKKPRA